MTIFHITTSTVWKRALELGVYEAVSLAEEGFIHCSSKNQVKRSAVNYFKGRKNLVLLEIEESGLTSKLVLENTTGGDELFPHVYGPLNLDAVIRIEPFDMETLE